MKKIRVLVIDDSAYNRRTISKILDGLPEIDVIGYATDGEEGIRKVMDLKPDLITLDLEMPKMDGFTLLRIIMTHRPTPVIVISSRGGSEGVFKALELGAVDFVVKPTNTISTELQKIREELLEKVRSVFTLNIAGARKRDAAGGEEAWKPSLITGCSIEVVAIGSSTGGPPALQNIFTSFTEPLPLAFVVSQHMPATFTRTFADRLNRASGLAVKEARNGDRVEKGMVLLSPGGQNMTFVRGDDGEVVVKLSAPSSEFRYVPSVDAMFISCAEQFGSSLLGVVLTGMGNDGSRGVVAVKEQGGQVIAESEESSVVFGMPKEAIASGAVDKVVPLERVAREIILRARLG